MKRILYPAVICAILIIAGISAQLLSPPKPLAKSTHPEEQKLVVWGSEESLHNITINTTIPNTTYSLPVYDLKVPQFNLSFCNDTINKYFSGWLTDDVKIYHITEDYESYVYSKRDEFIIVMKSGLLRWENNSVARNMNNFVCNFLEKLPFQTNSPNYAGYTENQKMNTSSSNSSSNNSTASPNHSNTTKVNNTSNSTVNQTKGNETSSNSSKSNQTEKNTTISNDSLNNSDNEKAGNNSLPSYTLIGSEIIFEGQLTEEEAYNKSLKFINSHGGLPEGWYFQSKSRTVTTRCWDSISFIERYTFRFSKKINGYPVVGVGEGINIRITSFGTVECYNVIWREIDSIKKNVTTVSAFQALVYLDKAIHYGVTVEKIEMGYYTVDSWDVQKEMNPVWIFYTNSEYDEYLCVDAVNLRIPEY